MGKMKKYLKQTAILSHILRDEQGKAILNSYGEPSVASTETVICRQEPYKYRAFTSMGQFVNYRTTYYLDSEVSIDSGDLLDGESVQDIRKYVDGLGQLIGYEVQV